ncbi:YjbF family lipoprotein [Escherichia coli]
MVDTFRASLFDNQDITVADQQIQALPYSTMYLRLNEGQRIFVVLGYIEQEQSKWLSQDNAMLVTHNGRLLQPSNLIIICWKLYSGQDPLRNALAIKDGSRWTRDILWSEDNHLLATWSSTFSFAGSETLSIAGRNVLCNVWQAGDFHVANTGKTHSGSIRLLARSSKSGKRQAQGVIPVEMTFL